MSDWLNTFLNDSFSSEIQRQEAKKRDEEEREKQREENFRKSHEQYEKEKEQRALDDFLASLAAKAVGYKKRISSSFVLVDGNKIAEKLIGANFSATKKIDGELRLIFITQRGAFSFNSAGKRDQELLCVKEFAALCKNKGIASAMFAAELTTKDEIACKKRCRVVDVIHALATPDLRETLALMPFDIVELEGAPYEEADYAKTHAKLCEIFGECHAELVSASPLVRPVPMRFAKNAFEVERIFTEVVTGGSEGNPPAEGLVVHGPQTAIYKIKPRHTIDAIAIGYTVSDLLKDGQKLEAVRDILFAVRDAAGNYQVFASGSNGLKDKERIELRERFESIAAKSAFIYSDSRSVAFKMIEPRYVFEVSFIDLISELSDESAITNPLLSYMPGFGYISKGEVAGVSAFSLCVVRERGDKGTRPQECGEHQLSDICPFSQNFHKDPVAGLPKSETLERLVYKKETRRKILVKKFIIIKTNKSAFSKNFSEYVLQFTDFSTSRAEMLKKEIFASNNLEQVKARLQALLEKEIKKGWEFAE